MKFRSLVLLMAFLSSSLMAQDKDQRIDRCGLYQSSGQLECMKMSDCFLKVQQGSLSELRIQLKATGKDVSYYDGDNVEIKILVTALGDRPAGEAVEMPVKIISAVGQSGLKLEKIEACAK